jgi:hypothetical protein
MVIVALLDPVLATRDSVEVLTVEFEGEIPPGGGGGGGPAFLQATLPESVNVFPTIGMNRQA